MFTGIITETGEVISSSERGGRTVLSLLTEEIGISAAIGDSVAVNGVCLTVVTKNGKEVSFDVSGETLRSTGLGRLRKGHVVNLEASLRPDSRIGGHFVTGHVDAVGRIRSKTNEGDMLKFIIEASPDVLMYLVKKGSVAVDGISLTVVDILKDSFTLVIIPHTAKVTTLGFKGPGDDVNIEVDILGKYVARFMGREPEKEGSLMKALAEGGFLARG